MRRELDLLELGYRVANVSVAQRNLVWWLRANPRVRRHMPLSVPRR
jgi:hypothetical protein